MNKIKALRAKYGVTQKQIGERLEYSESQIQRLENSDKSWGNQLTARSTKLLDDLEKELEAEKGGASCA